MPKVSSATSLLLTVLLISGCYRIATLPTGTPDKFNETVEALDAMRGWTSKEVVTSVGQPMWVIRKHSITYYLYAWGSRNWVLGGIGIVPLPYPPLYDINRWHCVLMEFTEEAIFQSYEVKTVDVSSEIRNCRDAFKIESNQRLSRLKKYDGASLKWLCRAAEEGHPRAQYRVAYLYENGEAGVAKDTIRAYVWYRKSGNQLAYQRVLRDLTGDDQVSAEILRETWSSGQCERDFLVDKHHH